MAIIYEKNTEKPLKKLPMGTIKALCRLVFDPKSQSKDQVGVVAWIISSLPKKEIAATINKQVHSTVKETI